MKAQKLVLGSILAVGIIAAVICVGMVTGFSGISPFASGGPVSNKNTVSTPADVGLYIIIDPVADKTTGDLLIVTGSTNLPSGTDLIVQTGNSNGGTKVRAGTGGVNRFSLPVDTSTIEPGTKTIRVTNMIGDIEKGDYRKGDVNTTASFTLKGSYLTTDTPVKATITKDDFIRINAIGDRSLGDQFLITGTTSLPAGTEIMWEVTPASFTTDPDQQTGTFTGVMANSQVSKGTGNTNRVTFALDTYVLLPGQYNVSVSTIAGDLTRGDFRTGDLMGSGLFTLRDSGESAVTGPFIRIDPVGDKNVGDAFTITGTTNLPAGTEILFQVYSASFEPTAANPQTSGFFTGATGTVAVTRGTGGMNTWSADLDTSTFEPTEYRVTAAEFTGDAKKGDFSMGMVSDKTLFTLRPASETGSTSQRPDHTVTGGILIDPIRDTSAGNLLMVTGRANLSVGTNLLVKVVPVSMQNGKITGDYQNPENAAVTKVVKGSGINNRFSVALDTRLLPPAEHMISVSNVKGNTAGIDSEPGSVTMSLLFNIIAGKAGTGQLQNDISVPSVFINPFSDVTAGDSLIVSGTTNLPVGAKFRVSVIPVSSTDYEHPELAATVSAVKGSPAVNLFSTTLATKDLPPGQHILIVSAEDFEVTGTLLFTVK
jgi:hypothetical protein